MKRMALFKVLLLATVAACQAGSHRQPTGMQATGLLRAVSPAPQLADRYLLPFEALEWMADEGSDVQVERVVYRGQDADRWAIIAFEGAEVSGLKALPQGRLFSESRMPTAKRPRLELRLNRNDIRIALDPQRPSVLLLLDPTEARRLIQEAAGQKRWSDKLALLAEIDRLGHETLGFDARELRDFYDLCPESVRVRFSRLAKAQNQLSRGQIALARKTLNDLRIERPTDWVIYYWLGLSYLQQQKYGPAIEDFRKAIEVAEVSRENHRLDPKLFCFLGRCYYEQYKDQETPTRQWGLKISRTYFERFLEGHGLDEEDRKTAQNILSDVEAILGTRPEKTDRRADGTVTGIHLRPPFKAIEDFRGNVILVHLWATFCGPCRKELPELMKFHRTVYPALMKKGLRLITVTNDFRSKDFLRYAQQLDLDLPIYWDARRDVQKRYGVDEGLPATLILGRDGRKIEVLMGVVDWLSPDFRARINNHLGLGEKRD